MQQTKSAKICLPLLPPISDHVIIQGEDTLVSLLNTPVYSAVRRKSHNCYLLSVQSHPLQRVKAEWNNDFRFGEKSAAASKSLLFPFVLDIFQAISVNFF